MDTHDQVSSLAQIWPDPGYLKPQVRDSTPQTDKHMGCGEIFVHNAACTGDNVGWCVRMCSLAELEYVQIG